MIFAGDIALPFPHAVLVRELPKLFHGKNWLGNFEGAIVDNSEILQKQYVVFNDREAIRILIKNFNFIGFAAANNHIFDAGSLRETIDFLEANKIPYVGLGENLQKSSSPLIIKEGPKEIVILNFGWEVIQCKVSKENRPGVNPLTKEHVLKSVKDAVKNFPNAFIIPFMHWCYELEAEPQPFEREMAKKLIDIGVSGVIGCHPHRIGGFEMYKGKPIVYSLGNWMFKQDYYHHGKLRFPDFCNQELAFEWDFEVNTLNFHFFKFDRINSTLAYTHSEGVESETMARFTPFRGLSDEAYKKWYKTNHFHRKKGLPIYYWEDSILKRKLKNRANKLRDRIIFFLNKLR